MIDLPGPQVRWMVRAEPTGKVTLRIMGSRTPGGQVTLKPHVVVTLRECAPYRSWMWLVDPILELTRNR